MHNKKWKACLAAALAVGALVSGNTALQDTFANEVNEPEVTEESSPTPEPTSSEPNSQENNNQSGNTADAGTGEETGNGSKEVNSGNETNSESKESSDQNDPENTDTKDPETSRDEETSDEGKPESETETKPDENQGEQETSDQNQEEDKNPNEETAAKDTSEGSSSKSDRSSGKRSGSSGGAVSENAVVPSPLLVQDFRFWTIAMDPAFAISDITILEDMDDEARQIGSLPKDGVCYIVQEEENGWVYVESGNVRGFAKSQDLITKEKASTKYKTLEMITSAMSKMTGSDLSIEDIADLATEDIPANENEAYTHTKSTVYQTIIKKDYAIATANTVSIRETASDDAREIGTIEKDGLMYIIADKDQEWVFVESGNVRGFVKAEEIIFDQEVQEEQPAENSTDDPEEAAKAKQDAEPGSAADSTGDKKADAENKDSVDAAEAEEKSEPTVADIVTEKGEKNFATAKEIILPKDNLSVYYSKASVKSGAPLSVQREAIIEYASQFIGNPYVWGGTDPVNGADCSGFVQTIFKQFGYYLPRTSQEQSRFAQGEKIAVEDAQPGDLIFYARPGEAVHHVVIYAGDGKTVEAMGRKYGIVTSTVNYDQAIWAVRVVQDNNLERFDIPEGLGAEHTYMGWQKITSRGSQQYAFREAAGMNFDEEGFGVVDGRYVIACTTTFGNIGDYIDFYQEDGTVIPCIIGDFKNQNDAGCTVWGHDGGKCIVEYVVDQSTWYGSGHANPGTSSCHPEWNQNIVKAEKVGSFYAEQ